MEGHLERLRRAELDAVRDWFRPGMRVLEIGGGSGYQASLIASWGCPVLSIDVEDRPPAPRCYSPVQRYDGRHIPAADASFDRVFSSNVLEHIRTLSDTLAEIHRVLQPDGLAVHIVPSAAWRLWTSVGRPVHWLKRLWAAPTTNALAADPASRRLSGRGLADLAKVALFDRPHGEYPSALSELYYFSRYRWSRLFRRHGFELVTATRNHLFYTGYELLPGLSLQTRRVLSHFFGSAGHIFVMRPSPSWRRSGA